MIQTKLSLDANERAGVESANRNALSAEELKIKQRQSAALEKQEQELNKPVPLRILKMGMVDDGEGPITKYLEEKVDAMGLIDRTNPGAPYIANRHVLPGGTIDKMMQQDVHKIHSLTTQYANSLMDQAKELQAKNPNDKQAAAMMDKGQRLLTQMTHTGAELEKMKLEQQERIKEAGITASNQRASEANTLRRDLAELKNSVDKPPKNLVTWMNPDTKETANLSPGQQPPSNKWVPFNSAVNQEKAVTASDIKQQAAEDKQQVKMSKDASLKRAIEFDLTSVDKVVDDLINSEGLQNLTGYTGRIPFTIKQSSVDAQAMLERLKSNLMIDVLQSIKAASANGSSGFGALNETEGKAIRDKLAALREATSYPQMIKELKGIKEWTAHTRENMEQTFNETWGNRPKKTLPTNSVVYKSPDDVKSDYTSGKITREEASDILNKQFGMEK
jgi:hypothetical protein